MGYALRRMWLPQRVASLLWNQWQVCRGMRGNFAMESVASFAWNQWQLSYGTGGNFRAEYAPNRRFLRRCARGSYPYGAREVEGLRTRGDIITDKNVSVQAATPKFEVKRHGAQ